MKTVILDGNSLTIEDFIAVVREGAKIELSPLAKTRVSYCREVVDRFVEDDQVIYGITTGFGKFSDVKISHEETKLLQRNLIISHATGVGDPFNDEITRGIMVLRANALAKGHSGIRLSTLETLMEMVNQNVLPRIPEKGSLGASGDLAPLSHMVLTLIGEGTAKYEGELMTSKEAMEKAGLTPVALTAKEGLALINGTQVMTAVGAITLYDGLQLSSLADVSAAMTMEALSGITDAYDERLHAVRPHPGQMKTASQLRKLLAGSKNTTRQGEVRVQDAYSLRCVPQIHGASKDALDFIKSRVEIEINAVTDNPIIFPEDGHAISGGNFHGQPMALPFDYMAIALSELANAAERRIERLVNPQLSGLPAFLTKFGGLHSGFMIAQYSAAALVSENKVLAHPASVDSIPSSANQEDHVSMGTIAARKARVILFNVQNVIAIELLAACQGIDLAGHVEGLSPMTKKIYQAIREKVATWEEDRIMHLDIDQVYEMITSGELHAILERDLV